MAQNKRFKILVLSGGPSSERDVSIRSGKNVFKNLDRKRYSVSSLVVSRNLNTFFTEKVKVFLRRADIVFIAMHGFFGEDGKIQSYLDSLGVAYTGSNAFSSALSMNKYFSTKVVESSGFSVPKTFLVSKNNSTADLAQIMKKLNFPLFVKPNNGGSSEGAGIAVNVSTLKKMLHAIFVMDTEALLQQVIDGKELTCGVLGNTGGDLQALPPVEIPKQGKFFDKEIKYSKHTIEICPARLSNSEMKKITEMSKKIHEALMCRGVSRSDFILSNGKFYYLETNTIPGMTESSLILKEAKAVGKNFPELLDDIINLALY